MAFQNKKLIAENHGNKKTGPDPDLDVAAPAVGLSVSGDDFVAQY